MRPQEQRDRFEQWLDAHAAIVHRTARAFTASEADRADLTQELMLAVWRAVPAFREEAKPATFIYRVTHNAAMMWLRGRQRHARLGRSSSCDPDELSGGEPVPDEHAARAQRLARMYTAIRQLGLLDRSLILLALDGVTYKQIAEIHGMTTNNVGVRLNRIRRRLAELLEEKKP